MASPHQLPPSDLGWLAAIIDGEGCLRVRKDGRPEISVEMRSLKTIAHLRDLVGGNTYHRFRRGSHFYRWFLPTKVAIEFLEALLPHFVTKQAQAEALLKFLIVRAHNRRRQDPALLTQIRAELTALKRGG